VWEASMRRWGASLGPPQPDEFAAVIHRRKLCAQPGEVDLVNLELFIPRNRVDENPSPWKQGLGVSGFLYNSHMTGVSLVAALRAGVRGP
jgi:hypothetical protein